jgi:hypothetical protein
MYWYHWISLASFCSCLLFSLFYLVRILRLGKPYDYATAAGQTSSAIAYSFTGAMSPVKKETAFLHLPTYIAGIVYHLGTFISIFIYFMIWMGVVFPAVPAVAMAIFLWVSSVSGIGILIKRVIKKSLRRLSNPDDYISNMLVTIFQLMTGIMLVWNPVCPVYYITTCLLLLYFPAGKLKHAIYFFAARYHLGIFYGSRGVWPPKQVK